MADFKQAWNALRIAALGDPAQRACAVLEATALVEYHAKILRFFTDRQRLGIRNANTLCEESEVELPDGFSNLLRNRHKVAHCAPVMMGLEDRLLEKEEVLFTVAQSHLFCTRLLASPHADLANWEKLESVGTAEAYKTTGIAGIPATTLVTSRLAKDAREVKQATPEAWDWLLLQAEGTHAQQTLAVVEACGLIECILYRCRVRGEFEALNIGLAHHIGERNGIELPRNMKRAFTIRGSAVHKAPLATNRWDHGEGSALYAVMRFRAFYDNICKVFVATAHPRGAPPREPRDTSAGGAGNTGAKASQHRTAGAPPGAVSDNSDRTRPGRNGASGPSPSADVRTPGTAPSEKTSAGSRGSGSSTQAGPNRGGPTPSSSAEVHGLRVALAASKHLVQKLRQYVSGLNKDKIRVEKELGQTRRDAAKTIFEQTETIEAKAQRITSVETSRNRWRSAIVAIVLAGAAGAAGASLVGLVQVARYATGSEAEQPNTQPSPHPWPSNPWKLWKSPRKGPKKKPVKPSPKPPRR